MPKDNQIKNQITLFFLGSNVLFFLLFFLFFYMKAKISILNVAAYWLVFTEKALVPESR